MSRHDLRSSVDNAKEWVALQRNQIKLGIIIEYNANRIGGDHHPTAIQQLAIIFELIKQAYKRYTSLIIHECRFCARVRFRPIEDNAMWLIIVELLNACCLRVVSDSQTRAFEPAGLPTFEWMMPTRPPPDSEIAIIVDGFGQYYYQPAYYLQKTYHVRDALPRYADLMRIAANIGSLQATEDQMLINSLSGLALTDYVKGDILTDNSVFIELSSFDFICDYVNRIGTSECKHHG